MFFLHCRQKTFLDYFLFYFNKEFQFGANSFVHKEYHLQESWENMRK